MGFVNLIVRLDPVINSEDCGEHPFSPSGDIGQGYVLDNGRGLKGSLDIED